MNHVPDSELFSAYLDGEVSAGEQARVERLLATDASARQLMDELRALRAALQGLPQQTLGEDLGPRVLRIAERRMLTGDGPAPAKTTWYGWPGIRWRGLLSRRALVWSGLAVAIAAMIMLAEPDRARWQAPREVAMTPRDEPAAREPGPPPELHALGGDAETAKPSSSSGKELDLKKALPAADKEGQLDRQFFSNDKKAEAETPLHSRNKKAEAETRLADGNRLRTAGAMPAQEQGGELARKMPAKAGEVAKGVAAQDGVTIINGQKQQQFPTNLAVQQQSVTTLPIQNQMPANLAMQSQSATNLPMQNQMATNLQPGPQVAGQIAQPRRESVADETPADRRGQMAAPRGPAEELAERAAGRARDDGRPASGPGGGTLGGPKLAMSLKSGFGGGNRPVESKRADAGLAMKNEGVAMPEPAAAPTAPAPGDTAPPAAAPPAPAPVAGTPTAPPPAAASQSVVAGKAAPDAQIARAGGAMVVLCDIRLRDAENQVFEKLLADHGLAVRGLAREQVEGLERSDRSHAAPADRDALDKPAPKGGTAGLPSRARLDKPTAAPEMPVDNARVQGKRSGEADRGGRGVQRAAPQEMVYEVDATAAQVGTVLAQLAQQPETFLSVSVKPSPRPTPERRPGESTADAFKEKDSRQRSLEGAYRVVFVVRVVDRTDSRVVAKKKAAPPDAAKAAAAAPPATPPSEPAKPAAPVQSAPAQP